MNIPGYYYDAEKKRYFKVENSKTAPTSAAWSSNNVKRRKVDDENAATALRHLNLAKSRIKRARVLHEPLTGGFFAREYGAMEDDMQAACFVDGLRNKGSIPISPGMQVKRMCVTGSDYKTGMSTVFAATARPDIAHVNEDMLSSTYLPRDKNKRLNQRLLANYRLPQHLPPPYIEETLPQISDIQYLKNSSTILVASRQPVLGHWDNRFFLWLLSPRIDLVNDDPLRPSWLLPSEGVRPVEIWGIQQRDEVHCIAPASESSALKCLVGTNRGIAQWQGIADCLTWPVPPNPKLQSILNPFRDIFTIDFHPNHTEIFRFGGRPGVLTNADLRTQYTSWSHLELPSTITHLKCLDGGNQVLVAGLQNQLGVYDLRFVRSFRGAEDDGGMVDTNTGDEKIRSTYHDNRSHNSQRNYFKGRNRGKRDKRGVGGMERGGNNYRLSNTVAQPVIKFEHYRNAAHIDIGFAYDADTGIVAAAHDDVPGTVALYSVRTGSRLRVLDFATEYESNGRAGHPRPILHVERERRRMHLPIIQSLQFHTFPGDHTPTLFVAGGQRGDITAFSFGVDDMEDEA
ncbi:hypothetical protein F4680DRAFT_402719 [Xylaria scruposa]|nr:hypothetical protein F4680DRAFT_402719 [Xylaria scruposa]